MWVTYEHLDTLKERGEGPLNGESSPTDMAASRVERWLKTLGPGILFASTCIGVSHLVQSTRQGRWRGLACVGGGAASVRYPFF